jgi:hypothetical protein
LVSKLFFICKREIVVIGNNIFVAVIKTGLIEGLNKISTSIGVVIVLIVVVR